MKTKIQSMNKVKILNFLPKIRVDNVEKELLQGLSAKQKYISPKYFYDEVGSDLFEQITHLEEYYPTRSEKSILAGLLKKIDVDFENVNLIELGSGDASKISLLLTQIPKDTLSTLNYFPVDISLTAIEKSIENLIKNFSLNSITGIVVDFIHQLDLIPKSGKRIFCFFGSTLGNFNPEERIKFIKQLGDTMQEGDIFLLGMDRVKNSKVLENAYNDSLGITSKFNKNILNVVNELIDSQFDVNNFEHLAFYNAEKQRIEMHLKAIQSATISFGDTIKNIEIIKGETIHTENSYKFTLEDIKEIAILGNLHFMESLSDANDSFSLAYYVK